MQPIRPVAGAARSIALTSAGYFALARFGVFLAPLATAESTVSPFWPAAGLALAAAILGSRWHLLGVALGAAASSACDSPWEVAVAVGLGAALSAAVGAKIHHAINRGSDWLGRYRETVAYLAASLAGPLPAVAVGGGLSVYLRSVDPWTAAPELLTWWSGDMIGMLVAAPAFVSCRGLRFDLPDFRRRDLLNGLLLAAATAAAVLWLLLEQNGVGLAFILLLLPITAFALAGEAAAKFASVAVVTLVACGVRNGSVHLVLGPHGGSPVFLNIFFGTFSLCALLVTSYSRRQLLAWPTFLLLGGWIASSWVFAAIENRQHAFDDYRLDDLVSQRVDNLSQRVRTYEDVLRSGASMLSIDWPLTRAKWRSYTASLHLFRLYPGIHGVGVAYPLREGEVPGFLERWRADYPGFTLHQVPGPHQTGADEAGYRHYLIAHIEPHGANATALGLDLASEASRREAAEHSRDTGQPHATTQIQLVQDAVSRPGFLLFLPVYAADRPTGTVAERRAAFLGWVYSPFVFEEFVRGALGATDTELDYWIYEGSAPRADRLLYTTAPGGAAAAPPSFERTTSLSLSQQNYVIGWVRSSRSTSLAHLPSIVSAGSLALASTLLAGLVFSLQRFAERANRLVRVRTAELEAANRTLQEATRQLQTKESEARKLALIASRTTNAVILTDAHGLIEWVNEGFVRMTGYTAEEAMGQKPGCLLQGPATDPQDVERFRQELRSGRGFVIELLNYRKDRSVFQVSIEVQPIFGPDGTLANFMGIQTDVTADRRAQRELKLAHERAEAASQAKSAFLGNISHELRTPLNVIIGNLQLLLQSRLGPLAEPQERALKSMEQNSVHLRALINDLLDLTRAESGKLALEPGPVDPRRLVDEVLGMLGTDAALKRLTMECRCTHRAALIEADALRLKQILINLLGNAVKFSPVGGRICLATEDRADPAEIIFTVSDTGPGIPPEDHERIFGDFEQGEAGRTAQAGGTGLGLAITRRLVHLHGGRITLLSEPGRGSAFSVHLPLRIPAVPPPAAPAEEQAGSTRAAVEKSSLLILIVEDYPANLELLASYLELEGYRVAQATSGEEALQRCAEMQPHLILMDVKMPGIGGLEATRRLKADPATRDIPVVALTAFARKSDMESCLEAGAADFLTKPVDFAQLDLMIAKHGPSNPA